MWESSSSNLNVFWFRYSFLHFVASISITVGVIITTSAEMSQKRSFNNINLSMTNCTNCEGLNIKVPPEKPSILFFYEIMTASIIDIVR